MHRLTPLSRAKTSRPDVTPEVMHLFWFFNRSENWYPRTRVFYKGEVLYFSSVSTIFSDREGGGGVFCLVSKIKPSIEVHYFSGGGALCGERAFHGRGV